MARTILLLIAVFLGVAPVRAQEQNTSNLVFLLDKSLSNNKFIFSDAKGKVADTKDWYGQYKNGAAFYRNFIVDTKQYKVNFPGPISSVTINTSPGMSTYIKLAPYRDGDQIVGVQITSWTGYPSKAVVGAVEYLKNGGFEEDILPTKLGITGDVIHFDPGSPWPIPPPK